MAYAGCSVSFTESSKPTYTATRQGARVNKPGPSSLPPPLPPSAAPLVLPLAHPTKLLESHPQQQQQQQLNSHSNSHPSLKSSRPRRPLFSPPSKPSLRGSLTEQLSAITSVVEGVTRELKARDLTTAPGTTTTIPPPPSPLISSSLLTLPVLQLRVGRVISRRGTPMHLFSDRAEFVFAHGTCEVSMTMYFRDIASSLRASGPSVSFRVKGGPNMVAFKGDYDESNTSHCIQLTFHSSSVAATLVQHVKRHAVQ